MYLCTCCTHTILIERRVSYEWHEFFSFLLCSNNGLVWVSKENWTNGTRRLGRRLYSFMLIDWILFELSVSLSCARKKQFAGWTLNFSCRFADGDRLYKGWTGFCVFFLSIIYPFRFFFSVSEETYLIHLIVYRVWVLFTKVFFRNDFTV